MIQDRVSDSAGALVKTIGSFIIASGAGADEDRLFKFIGGLGPRLEEPDRSFRTPLYSHRSRTITCNRQELRGFQAKSKCD